MAQHPPLIAIDGPLAADRPSMILDHRYADAVLRAGGIPVAVPPVGGPGDVAALLDRVDGLLLAGGDDFDTERLGRGPIHPAADPTPGSKQDFDFTLARLALERGMPVLGICYGMQVLGLLAGGGLLQHLPDDRPGCREHTGGVEHDVRVVPGTKLAAALGVKEVMVVSRHHQALADVPDPWCVAATDDEGLIEAIERTDRTRTGQTRPDRTWAIGVQWHPELSPPGSPNDRIFRDLVSAAGLRAQQSLADASSAGVAARTP